MMEQSDWKTLKQLNNALKGLKGFGIIYKELKQSLEDKITKYKEKALVSQ